MIRSSRVFALVVVAVLCFAGTPGASAQGSDGAEAAQGFAYPHGVLRVEPEPSGLARERTPVIIIEFDPQAGIDPDSVSMDLNGLDVTIHEDFQLSPEGVRYQVPGIFALSEGMHNATIRFQPAGGGPETLTWSFVVDLTPPPKLGPAIGLGAIIAVVLAVIVALVIGVLVVLAYLKRTRNFTLAKFFARHPVHRNLLVLYVPLGLAGVSTLFALYWITTLAEPPRFALEFVFLGGTAIGLGPYAVDVQRGRARLSAAERAYAQFLFELADALRGGIDPLKAIKELAKTDTGILGKHLRVAADGIRMGRPFEEVMQKMARKLGSPLIERYALLVAEASMVGGEIASVVHRAAKDMDEMVKVDRERARQMKTPVMTMYIAYLVLMLMVKSLMDFAPGLADTDFGALSASVDATAASGTARMSLLEMQDRFFHLVVITSIGTGLLIGSFTDGKLRYGMVHAFVMALTAALFYRFVVL